MVLSLLSLTGRQPSVKVNHLRYHWASMLTYAALHVEGYHVSELMEDVRLRASTLVAPF